jgi:hypothetical protein
MAAFPPALIVLGLATAVFAVWLMYRHLPAVERFRASTGAGLAIRAIWVVIAGWGLVGLVHDITAIATIT